MTNRYAIVLAAGQGTRMKSKLYKVLHPVCGKPMINHVIDQVTQLKIDEIVTVVGHGAEEVKKQLGDRTKYVLQAEQLGTAHAVEQAEDLLANRKGTTIVVCGDTPLIKAETIDNLFAHHEETGASATILTADIEDTVGYGRIVRDQDASILKIVEDKDASAEEKLIKEVNTGTYCFDNEKLFAAIKNVSNDNAQGEYYLPDVIEIMRDEGGIISGYKTSDSSEIIGINDRVALAEAEETLKLRINKEHLINGVTIIDPNNTYIGADVKIDPDTIIYPGTSLNGKTVIGSDCEIGPNTRLTDTVVKSDTIIKESVIANSEIGNNVNIGPFAHIRPGSQINNEIRIGNFVEIKNSQLGQGSKVSHLSYVGDAEVGKNVNFGCGSITVNYDGHNKFLTKVEDDVFVGCNSNLVAPVTVKKGAYLAAGSTITEDVPEEALAIARSRQTNKEDYVKKLKLNK